MPGLAPLKVLLAVDGSTHSEAAATLVGNIAWPAGVSIEVLAVAATPWSLSGLTPQAQSVLQEPLAMVQQAERTSALRLAQRTAETLCALHLQATPVVCEGRPSDAILKHAFKIAADLIVIGARGLSAPGEHMLGSTAHTLAQSAVCSVLVVRPLLRPAPLTLILAADGSAEAQRAADFLCCLGLPRWAAVRVVSVAEVRVALVAGESEPSADVPPIARKVLLDVAEDCASEVVNHLQDCQAQVRSTVRIGAPAAELLAAAREHDSDLIVVGARGPRESGPVPLGSVSQKLLRYAPCSVLLVR